MKRCKTCHKKKKFEGRNCSTCRSRASRAKDLMRYAFVTLRNNAKRRKKPFALTFEQFKKFCYETDYIQNKGKTVTSYSVDCKEADIGYYDWNLQVLTLRDNARKGKKILVYDWQYKHATVVDYTKRLTNVVEENF